MTREEIGSYLGLKLETVSRAFSKFSEDGIIEVKQRYVKILAPDALKKSLIPKPTTKHVVAYSIFIGKACKIRQVAIHWYFCRMANILVAKILSCKHLSCEHFNYPWLQSNI